MDQVFHRIPESVAALIPYGQLQYTKKYIVEFENQIHRLAIALRLCPKIGATDGAKEHPAIFHYFNGSTDIYIGEYDGVDLMFGYTILNGDLQNAEWGYTSLSEITSLPQMNIDYYFPVQTIEAALYIAYPNRYQKPQSLAEKSA